MLSGLYPRWTVSRIFSQICSCLPAALKTGNADSTVYSEKTSTVAVPLLPAGLGVASMLIALLVRVLVTYICVLCAGFNLKEKAFIALAWMPKATVQVCAQWLNLVLLDFLQLVLRRSPFFWSFSGCYRLHGFRHGPE